MEYGLLRLGILMAQILPGRREEVDTLASRAELREMGQCPLTTPSVFLVFLHGQRESNPREPNANYIPLARIGGRVGLGGFLDTNMLV